jgi:hypothetical protein
MATASFIGRNSAGVGVPEVLSTATTRVMLAINNVDNTSDLNKPISNAVQAALNAKGDIHITGATFSGANILNLRDNSGSTITTTIDNFSGITVNGNANISGNLTAANISTGPNGSAVIGTGGLVIGSGGSPTNPGTGDLVVNGNITVYGQAFSAFTSELYVEDSNLILNYNPTGDTHTTALGAGITIQDGFNVSASADAFFNIAETNVPVDLTDAYSKVFWESNVSNMMLGSTGGTGTGHYVLLEFDVLNGGTY